MPKRKTRWYLGIDIGGTKILAALADETGCVAARLRTSTPRAGPADEVLAAVGGLIDRLLAQQGLRPQRVAALGIAVPGVVDPKRGRVVVTPNMNLSGVEIVPWLAGRYHLPVALGNDCNLGTLGEAWLGAARRARSAFGMFVGTGIGGGFVRKGKLWRGARQAAGEIGHIVMQPEGGLRCGCGNTGCLETLASRSAIENQIRAAVAAGRSTLLTEWLEGDLGIIRSRAIRQALDAHDPLVGEVVRRAAEILGRACLTIRHLLDPERIVLGGGLVEACSEFIMPIVEEVVANDQLPGARPGGQVLLSALGDDAVVLGAVALARMAIGRSPFRKKYDLLPGYPKLTLRRDGTLAASGKVHRTDVVITAEAKLKKRKPKHAETPDAVSLVTADELQDLCGGGPEVFFLGTGSSDGLQLTDEAQQFLRRRGIALCALPTPQVVDAYNRSTQRRAALLRIPG